MTSGLPAIGGCDHDDRRAPIPGSMQRGIATMTVPATTQDGLCGRRRGDLAEETALTMVLLPTLGAPTNTTLGTAVRGGQRHG